MKKLIVIGIVSTMVMGLAVAAMAAPLPTWTFDPDWFVQLRPSSSTNGKNDTMGSCKYGTVTGATDSPAGGTDVSTATPVGSGTVDLGAYDLATDVSNRAWINDMRAPLAWGFAPDGVTPVVKEKVWHLKLYADAGFAGANIILTGWNTTAAASKINAYGTVLGGPHVALYSVETFGGARTLLFEFNPLESGAYSTSGVGYSGTFHQVSLPFGAKGLAANPYLLELVAVPEPGSMLAMLSGLIGLIGFGARRRK